MSFKRHVSARHGPTPSLGSGALAYRRPRGREPGASGNMSIALQCCFPVGECKIPGEYEFIRGKRVQPADDVDQRTKFRIKRPAAALRGADSPI